MDVVTDSKDSLRTECICVDPEHIMSFRLFRVRPRFPEDEPELFVDVQMSPKTWGWRRWWNALRYAMGRNSAYGNGWWHSGSLNKDSAIRLRALIDEYLAEFDRMKKLEGQEAGKQTE